MKKLTPIIAASFAASLLSTQALALDAYVEIQAGVATTEDLKTNQYSSTEVGEFALNIEHDVSSIFGVELGISDFEPANVLRLGISWDNLSPELDTITINTTGGTEFASGIYETSSAELESYGYEFENDINIYSANLYYDFPSERNYRFYIGAGYGLADIENADAEGAFSVSLGGRYMFTDRFYVGLRYKAFFIESPKDDLGIQYHSIRSHTYAVTLGLSF